MTLRNFGKAAVAAVILFIGFTVYSELRGRSSGDYGRLFSRELPPRVQAVEVVREATPPVDDQTHADPMLVAPMAREQWLEGDPAATTTITPVVPPVAPVQASATDGGDVTIVGGPDGVAIVRAPRQRGVLAGGFGR